MYDCFRVLCRMVPPLFLANRTCHPQIAATRWENKNSIDQRNSADIGPDDLRVKNPKDGRNPAPPGIYR